MLPKQRSTNQFTMILCKLAKIRINLNVKRRRPILRTSKILYQKSMNQIQLWINQIQNGVQKDNRQDNSNKARISRKLSRVDRKEQVSIKAESKRNKQCYLQIYHHSTREKKVMTIFHRLVLMKKKWLLKQILMCKSIKHLSGVKAQMPAHRNQTT